MPPHGSALTVLRDQVHQPVRSRRFPVRDAWRVHIRRPSKRHIQRYISLHRAAMIAAEKCSNRIALDSGTSPGVDPCSLVQGGGGQNQEATLMTPMAADDVTHHSVPEIVINRDGPEDRRVAFVDDYGGKIELSA